MNNRLHDGAITLSMVSLCCHSDLKCYFCCQFHHNFIITNKSHSYYLSGRTAKVQDFLNISVLNTFKKEMEVALNIVRTSPRPLPILLTETSSCFGGGAPHLSDAYLSGFM